jgi:uncharacterized protein
VSLADAALLLAAAFLAGAVNAVAGGGSLISFPALLAAGYGSVAANVTNNVALMPGYLGGTIGYRRELVDQKRRAVRLAISAAAGSVLGAMLLLVLPPGVFKIIVPWLILAACALLAAQDRLKALTGGEPRPRAVHAGVFLGCVYGGYFGAGLGIALLAILGLTLPDDLQRLNALKGLLSLVVSVAAGIGFVLFGPVAWGPAALMAGASLAGGRVGVSVAKRLPSDKLRALVIVFGVAVAVALLIRG